jgi:TetR/AcrR family transcriptional regulator
VQALRCPDVVLAPEHPPTREAILQEALHRFAEQGYAATSLSDIATRVGIRKPSLLHHFSSKEALYGEVFERILSDWFESLEQAVAARATGWEKLETVLEVGFRFLAGNPEYVRLMRREAIDGGAHLGIDLAAVLRPQFDRAVGWFDREMAAGRFREHDPAQLIVSGYGALLTHVSDAPFLAGLLDDDPLSDEMLHARLKHIVAFFRAALEP